MSRSKERAVPSDDVGKKDKQAELERLQKLLRMKKEAEDKSSRQPSHRRELQNLERRDKMQQVKTSSSSCKVVKSSKSGADHQKQKAEINRKIKELQMLKAQIEAKANSQKKKHLPS